MQSLFWSMEAQGEPTVSTRSNIRATTEGFGRKLKSYFSTEEDVLTTVSNSSNNVLELSVTMRVSKLLKSAKVLNLMGEEAISTCLNNPENNFIQYTW